MTEKSLEEQANELLRGEARKHGVSMRRLGLIDADRQRAINDHEIPMSSAWPNSVPVTARPDSGDDWEDE